MGQNRTQITTGIYKTKYSNPIRFKEWKVFINERGMVLVGLTGEKRGTMWHTNPYNPNIKNEIVFDNPKVWEIYEEQVKIALENQLKRFPFQYDQQLEDSEFELKLSKERKYVPTSQEFELA